MKFLTPILAKRLIHSFSVGLITLAPTTLLAAPQNLVDLEELTATTIQISSAKTKDIFCLEAAPGLAKARGSQYKFTSFKARIRLLKKKGAPIAKIKKFRKFNKLGKIACASIPEPTPTPTPTPSPTPIPPVENPYFDFTTGNVKDAGKVKFEIPENIDANLFRGEDNVPHTCSCHDNTNRLPQNLTFPTYRQRTAGAPMFFDENTLTDEELADIVAWLNRSQS